MLRLVAKSFYNELINYGVNPTQVLTVAGHLLDNVMQVDAHSSRSLRLYNELFTTEDIVDQWANARRLCLHQVSIAPLEQRFVPQVALWLEQPAVRDTFYPRFPEDPSVFSRYFQVPDRRYFGIFFQDQFVGIIGAEHIDADCGRLEMRKLVGDPLMHGKGIGKRATFLFLYYAFLIGKFNKVYLHSLDINIRNINLNARFGFEVEGVFLEEAVVENKARDVIRMGLFAPVWLKLFQNPAPARNSLDQRMAVAGGRYQLGSPHVRY